MPISPSIARSRARPATATSTPSSRSSASRSAARSTTPASPTRCTTWSRSMSASMCASTRRWSPAIPRRPGGDGRAYHRRGRARRHHACRAPARPSTQQGEVTDVARTGQEDHRRLPARRGHRADRGLLRRQARLPAAPARRRFCRFPQWRHHARRVGARPHQPPHRRVQQSRAGRRAQGVRGDAAGSRPREIDRLHAELSAKGVRLLSAARQTMSGTRAASTSPIPTTRFGSFTPGSTAARATITTNSRSSRPKALGQTECNRSNKMSGNRHDDIEPPKLSSRPASQASPRSGRASSCSARARSAAAQGRRPV